MFVLLDKLAPGDTISLDYQSHRYTYQVTDSKVVEPTDVGVLSSTSSPTLTLITCTPPGTSLRRLVVTAKQIDPDPNKATTVASAPSASSSASSGSSNLPSSAPGFFNQVSNAWNGVVSGFKSLFGGSDNSGAGTSGSSGTDTSSPSSLPAINSATLLGAFSL